MNALGFKPDVRIADVLHSPTFTLSAEIIPPRNGTEQSAVLEQIRSIIDSGAQFLSVTKGAGGSLRGGSLPIAQAVKERFGVPCIAHFTCRDLTPHEVENQLIDHHYFGIRNILALRGDPPMDQPHWVPKEGSYPYAYQLIEQIRDLNRGKYLTRESDKEFKSSHASSDRTDFCIGAAVYPEHPVASERVHYFKRKVEAGAEYFISQMLFDPEVYARFLDEVGSAGMKSIPILPGSRILSSQTQAKSMSEKFQVSVPEWLLKRLPEKRTPGDRDQEERAIETMIELIGRFKKYGAPGVHLFVLFDTKGCSEVLRRLSLRS